MQRSTMTVALTLAMLVLFVGLPDTVNGACCRSTFGQCRDCTRGTPCCGYGRCNIFCCNCDRGCRVGGCRGKRSISDLISAPAEDSTGADVVAIADKDADGNLTLSEAADYLSARGIVATPRSLAGYDVNNDGLLTAEEIDE